MAPRKINSTTSSSSSAAAAASFVPSSYPSPRDLQAELDEMDFSDCSSLSSVDMSLIESPADSSLPTPDESSAGRSQDEEDQPPAKKKRRVAGPKERRTQLLDLSCSYSQQESQIDLLVNTIRRHRKIVVIAGAGISTSAGIPDFRSDDGLFKTLQKKHNLKASGKLLFDAAVYQDEALTASFQEMVRSLSQEAENTQPTDFHHMLARLGCENRLTRLYTQNIDGIETSMPPLATQVPLSVKAPWPRTIQLHGSIEMMVCQKCRHMRTLDRKMFDRPDAPECPECTEKNLHRVEAGQRSHGIGKMRPRIVLYNEHNPDEEAITSVMNADIRSRPGAMIVVGTSLKIPGVRRLVKSLATVIRGRRNGVTMWINNEPPSSKEFEDCFDLVVKGDCERVAQLAQLKRWNDDSEPVFNECNSADVERIKSEQGQVSVVIQTPKKSKAPIQTGMLTPSSSHDGDAETTLSNPASKGRKLTEILKNSKEAPKNASKKAPKATAKGAKKPAPKKQTKKQPQPAKNAKITTFSRVTKGAKATPDEKSVKLEKDDLNKAMHPLPPGAARNNGPISLVMLGDSTPTSKSWRDPETISPKSIPNGMSDLLNQPTA